MTTREQKSMHILKQLFDAYNDLPIKTRMNLRASGFSLKIDEIPPVLKLYKDDIGKEIATGVAVSRINERFTNEIWQDGEIVVL